MTDPLLHAVLAWALAVLFGSAALHKLRHAGRFQAGLEAYRILPAAFVAPAGWLLGALEAIVAVTLPWPGLRAFAAALAFVLLAIYAGAIGVNLLRGRDDIDCGCGDTPLLLSPWLLARNGVLLVGAAVLMLPASTRGLSWADVVLAALSLPVLLLLYRGVEQLLENASRLREWRTSGD